jgi:hypothetical protein
MKRFFGLLSIFAVILSLAGCAANSTSGSITVQNKTTTAVQNAKVGSVTIGYLAAGATTTVYFYTEESGAQVSADSFSSFDKAYTGTIDLKFGYLYTLSFFNNNLGSVYYISGAKVGGKNTDSDYTIDMK